MYRPTDEPDARPPDPAQLDPAVLGALLARHGWRRRGAATGPYARWTPPGGTYGTSLLVPCDRRFPDSTELLAEALAALDRSAAPSAREVLTGLAVPSDEVRWEREVPDGGSGAARWVAQEQLRGAARAMLVAGALGTYGRAGYYGARHKRRAEDFLNEVLVGPAAAGRRLTAFVPVRGGRTAVAGLQQALHAARDATDYQRATGGMEAFDAAVGLGVCHELTQALIALVREAEGVRIAIGWSPAAGTPAGCPARPEPVEFSPGDLPALQRAAQRYVRAEPSLPVQVTGAVVRLRRERPDGRGTVRLRVLAGADVVRVRVALGEEDYRIAGHAHLAGLPIRVSGRLESRGGFRRITGGHDVTPVHVDEAERDRLLKSLQENPGFFEEACGEPLDEE
ncbi:hypothetical protein SSP35_02_04810 [Streptomyces sp. NBRC 110611]|uniref:hypothetical protein n=1 Tax=Streptomyces sp. NBRC 110611 TaxID=1621259 RepID=UPI00082EE854|nr:hypothetical protein [Streptomyces sp. NBRC 110611]GAU66112.1 hypothetical protein SSP35_02_04810 [Streptomyces sp. NBRC 110611]